MRKVFFVAFLLLLCIKSYEQTQGTVPILNSDPGSAPVLYIDFNGQYVTGTPWNWSGPINAAPSGLSNAAMKEIFASVAADFRIFKVNITTDPAKYNAAPATARIRVIVTTTSNWYGSAGGVSYIGSFTWGDDTPSWVFSALLKYDPKKIAEAISHESGHTLGLQHQSLYDANCNKLNEYYPGTGTFSSGWSPIMGNSYFTNASTWMKGKNTLSCGTIQDDIATIAGYPNNLPVRTDDIGDTYTNAKVLNIASTINANGIITTSGDRDVFSITTTTLRRLQLNITPESAGPGDKSANLNIKLSLLNKVGGVIKSYSPSTLSAKLDTTLRPARYFLQIEGTYSTTIPDYGSVGKYTIQGTSTPTTTLLSAVNLSGSANENLHNLEWSIEPDIAVKDIEVLQSADGQIFHPIQHFEKGVFSFTNRLAKASTIYYQVMVTDTIDEPHYSKIISLSGSDSKRFSVVVNAQERSLQIIAEEPGDFEIFTSNGQLFQKGQLFQGYNLIQVQGNQRGIFIFKGITRSGSTPVKFIFP